MSLFVGVWLLAWPGNLRAQSPTCKVLDLDSNESCVELPPQLFTNDVVTVEGWVKWQNEEKESERRREASAGTVTRGIRGL